MTVPYTNGSWHALVYSADTGPSSPFRFRNELQRHRHHLAHYLIALRFTPVAPHWFINMASPIVKIPIHYYFIGGLRGGKGLAWLGAPPLADCFLPGRLRRRAASLQPPDGPCRGNPQPARDPERHVQHGDGRPAVPVYPASPAAGRLEAMERTAATSANVIKCGLIFDRKTVNAIFHFSPASRLLKRPADERADRRGRSCARFPEPRTGAPSIP